MAIQMEEGRLVKIKEVLKEMPSPHYRYPALCPGLARLKPVEGGPSLRSRDNYLVQSTQLSSTQCGYMSGL